MPNRHLAQIARTLICAGAWAAVAGTTGASLAVTVAALITGDAGLLYAI